MMKCLEIYFQTFVLESKPTFLSYTNSLFDVVLKRDNWKCVKCGNKATQVHHKRYLKYKIGKEPIKWLVSLCADCHKKEHS